MCIAPEGGVAKVMADPPFPKHARQSHAHQLAGHRSHSLPQPVAKAKTKEQPKKTLHLAASQPIPIRKTDPEPNDLEDTVDSTHYDWATWRMYTRITNARRLRSLYQTEHPQGLPIANQECVSPIKDNSNLNGSTSSLDLCRQQTPFDDFAHGEVFILDLM